MTKPFKHVFKAPYLSIGLLLVGVLFLMTGTTQAAGLNTQTQQGYDTGHATCGAYDLKANKLLPACGFKRATKIGRANTKCPSGTFADIGTGGCYTCPRGFNRTAYPVTEANACSKQISPQYKYAKRTGAHKSCPGGTFKDPRNGGECWKCPSEFGRTMAAVTEWNACGKAFAEARRAEFVDRVCGEGEIVDLNGSCYVCPDGYRRTAAAATGHNACFRDEEYARAVDKGVSQCKAGEIFDLIDGGTCWTCPTDYLRSVFPINKGEACENPEMSWEPVKRTGNGLFGLPGGHELAVKLIYDRTRIDKGIKAAAQAQTELTEQEVSRTTWGLIKAAPEKSQFLSAMAFGEVLDLIKNGTKTKPEKDLLNYVARYVQDTRIISAKEISLAHQSYTRGIEARAGNMHSSRSMSAAYNFGISPPDYKMIVADATALLPTGITVMTIAGLSIGNHVSPAMGSLLHEAGQTVLPYAFRKASQEIAKVAVETGVKQTSATVAGSASSGFGAFLGPFAIVTGYSIMFSIAMDQVIDQEKASAQINDALQTAKQPVNLSRLVKTKEGRDELLTNWALMTQVEVAPVPALWTQLTMLKEAMNIPKVELVGDVTVVTPSSSSSASTMPTSTKWESIAGRASDVAIGSDGTAYMISAGGVSDNGIYQRAKTAKDWTKIQGAAVRVAVEGTRAWVVNHGGDIFARNGSGWKKIAGPAAQDIGASAKGVWIIGVDGKIHKREGNGWKMVPGTAQRIDIDQDGRPLVVNEKGIIFVHDNNQKWQKLPGDAIDVAADVPGLARIVGKDGKTYVFNGAKKNWTPIAEDTDSKSIGAGGGQVWRVSKHKSIYRLK